MAFDDTPDLDFAGDAGLASSPATAIMPGFGGGDASVAEQFGFKSGPSGMLSAASPDLGFAASAPPLQTAQDRLQSDKDYLANLPTHMKIGLALQAFSAGVAGTESPIDKLLKRKHEQDAAARKELVDTTGILTKAFEEIRKYDKDSMQGKALVSAYKRLLPPEMGKALDAIGTDQEDTAKSLTGLVADPDVQTALIKTCGRDRACWVKQVNDKDWMTQQYQTVDTKRMASALPKLRAFKEQVIDKGGLNAKKDADGKVTLTWPELVEGNGKLKLFSDAEMDTFRRNPDYLIPYGIKTTKGLAVGEAEAAKLAERPTKEDFKEGATRQILDQAGTTLQQEFKGGKWTTIGKKGDKTKELTPGQKLKLERETRAYDEAVTKLKEYGIGPDGASSRSEVQKRLLPTAKSGHVVPDPQFAGRVREWMRRRDAGDPRQEIPGKEAPKPQEAPKPAAEPKPAAAAKPAAVATRLSSADRQKVIDAATAAVNKGADPEAVKRRLKEKFGIEVTFASKKN